MSRIPAWIDPGHPRNAKEWKKYNAVVKNAEKEYWDSCSDDKKTVMEAVRKLQGYNDAHTRHLMMALFMGKVCGHENTPKAEVQYKVCAERLDEFLEFFAETETRQKQEFEEGQ